MTATPPDESEATALPPEMEGGAAHPDDLTEAKPDENPAPAA